MKAKFLFLFFLTLIIGISDLCAKDSDKDSLTFRSFDQESIEVYKENSDYYSVEAAPPMPWNRFIKWLSNKLKLIFQNVPETRISSVLEIVFKISLWAIGIFAVLMIFITLFKHGVFNVVQKNDKEIDLIHQNLEDQVLETNWQELIDIEIHAGRFNVALRLLFLQTIQLLNEKQLINWEKNKTNYDYAKELQKNKLDSSFRTLMQYYNFGWFGDFKINDTDFNEIHAEFKSFNTSIL